MGQWWRKDSIQFLNSVHERHSLQPLSLVTSMAPERTVAWSASALLGEQPVQAKVAVLVPGRSLRLVCLPCSWMEQMSACFFLLNDDVRFPVFKIQFHMFWIAVSKKICLAGSEAQSLSLQGIFALQIYMDRGHRRSEWWQHLILQSGAADWREYGTWLQLKYINDPLFPSPLLLTGLLLIL
jgi:hypothetical protein